MSRALVVIVVLLGLIGTPRQSAAQNEDQTCDRLPRNVQIYEMFRPTVQLLIEQSPTLQRQCRIIAAAVHVRIVIQTRSPEGGPARARATIARHEAGALRATIVLPISQDMPELLAHELEHVIEQIEGVDLAALARRDSSQATRDHQGTFETARATRAGQAAAAEIETRQAELALARREARSANALKANLRKPQ